MNSKVFQFDPKIILFSELQEESEFYAKLDFKGTKFMYIY